MLGKLGTWLKALGVMAQNSVFWSPDSFRRAQRFIGHVNRFGFLERTANPELKEVLFARLFRSVDITKVALAEYSGTWGGLSLDEILFLCFLCRERQPRTLLEIGTFQGITTLNLALNASPDALVTTVDLPEEDVKPAFSITEPQLTRDRARVDLWRKHGVGGRIRQILADSASLSPSDLPQGVDLAFIDGSHSYEYLRNDAELVTQVLSQGAIVLWHDYAPTKEGVYRYLNELARARSIVHVSGTELAFFDSSGHWTLSPAKGSKGRACVEQTRPLSVRSLRSCSAFGQVRLRCMGAMLAVFGQPGSLC